ncbi:MAG: NOL1/NOP2/sun family putative RNA methylase [Deltaproteobacteria bacterium]|nr:NOL1/NOP2/sun family putative RNA methylase [Deltaproteobacteria bacterium]MBW2068961.1 NOL1/NOP2/sun family putative RNA methylase [Deltaproteobacteria bacterium]
MKQPFLERYRDIVEDWNLFLEFINRPLEPGVWVNTLKTSVASFMEFTRAIGVDLIPVKWCPFAFRTPDFRKITTSWTHLLGLCHVHDIISILPVLLLNLEPGDLLLDLCAAPGNKTALSAVLMNNKGLVVANDADRFRLQTVDHMTSRMGTLNVVTTRQNGANFPKCTGYFDKVLVDAPCSCEGTSRRDPSVLRWCSEKVSQRMSILQKRLLERAVKLCKPGGRIVYSTCTYAPEENEMVIQHVLDNFADEVRVMPVDVPGLKYSRGIDRWKGNKLSEQLINCARVWPHQNDTGGFFVAVLEKFNESDIQTTAPTSNAGQWVRENPHRLLKALKDRFGIDTAFFDDYVFYRKGKKKINIASPSFSHWPGRVLARSVGIPFVTTQITPPKLTTGAATLFGSLAERNFVELERDYFMRYLEGQTVELQDIDIERCDSSGHVLVRYKGITSGLGILKKNEPAGYKLHSMFPRRWFRAYSIKHA